MITFFDFETTGLADFRQPPEAPGQPHMVSCAAVLTDHECNELQSFRFIAQPDGTPSSERALETHKITQDIQRNCGVHRATIMSALFHFAKWSDEYVAFNFDYDEIVALGELHRLGKLSPFTKKKTCEMRAMTSFCRIPSPHRAGDFKWPSLQQAHKHAFGTEFDGAHDAMADVRAMIRIHKWRISQ